MLHLDNYINLISGKLGSGKSLFLVALAYINTERTVFANFPINLPNCKILEAFNLELIDFGSLAFIDEGYINLDSREFSLLENKVLTKKLLQVRKRGLEVYIVSQLPRMIDVRVRELINSFIYAKRIGKTFFYTIHTLYGTKQVKIPVTKAEKLFPLYNSHKLFDLPETVESTYLEKVNPQLFVQNVKELYNTGIFQECKTKFDIKMVLIDSQKPLNYVDYIYSLLKREMAKAQS